MKTEKRSANLLPDSFAPNNLRLRELVGMIVESFDAHKAERITVLDMRGVVDFLDAMVIASGTSLLHNRTLAEHMLKEVAGRGILPFAVQEELEADWVAVDYGPVIVHIFLDPVRSHYNLEDLWVEAERYDIGLPGQVR